MTAPSDDTLGSQPVCQQGAGQEVSQPEVRQRLQREFCLQGLKDSEAAELQGLALLILNAESQRALEEAVGG